MRRRVACLVVGLALITAPAATRAQAPIQASSPIQATAPIQVSAPIQATAPAQAPGGTLASPYRMNGYFAAPGLYGMSYGSASYGVPQTYTTFNSPMSPGYAYGYAPYGLLPGRYGVGLWRPGFVAPGYVYGASYYRSFALPGVSTPPPPVGVYAPSLGPSNLPLDR